MCVVKDIVTSDFTFNNLVKRTSLFNKTNVNNLDWLYKMMCFVRINVIVYI